MAVESCQRTPLTNICERSRVQRLHVTSMQTEASAPQGEGVLQLEDWVRSEVQAHNIHQPQPSLRTHCKALVRVETRTRSICALQVCSPLFLPAY